MAYNVMYVYGPDSSIAAELRSTMAGGIAAIEQFEAAHSEIGTTSNYFDFVLVEPGADILTPQ